MWTCVHSEDSWCNGTHLVWIYTEDTWTSWRQLRKSQKLRRRQIIENHDRNGEINMLRGINSKHNLNQPESNWINLVNQTESTWINQCYATRMPLAFVQLYVQTINFCVLSENSQLQTSAAEAVSAPIYTIIVINDRRHQRSSSSTIFVINDCRHRRSSNTHLHLLMYRLNSECFSTWLIWTIVQF